MVLITKASDQTRVCVCVCVYGVVPDTQRYREYTTRAILSMAFFDAGAMRKNGSFS